MPERSRAKPCSLRRSFTRLAWPSMLLSCLVGFHSYGATGNDPAPDNIETRMRACTPCHGVQGQGTSDDYFPRLAGKPGFSMTLSRQVAGEFLSRLRLCSAAPTYRGVSPKSEATFPVC